MLSLTKGAPKGALFCFLIRVSVNHPQISHMINSKMNIQLFAGFPDDVVLVGF